VTPADPTVTLSVCDTGVPTDPDVDTPTTEGIEYTIEGTIAGGNTVIVRASITTTGLAFPATLPGDWQLDTTDGTATLSVTLLPAPGCGVTPIYPTITQSVCEDGVPSDSNVVPVTTDNIEYTIEGDVEAGNTVVVRATITDPNLAFPSTLPGDWELDTTNGTATLEVVLNAAPNCVITPVDPTVTQSVCDTGAPTDPSIDPATTANIEYAIEGNVDAGNTVAVRATLSDSDLAFPATLPGDWEFDAATGTATLDVVLTGAPNCVVIPVNPTVTQSVCNTGVPTDPAVVPASTANIEYSIEGTVAGGNTVVVRATATDTDLIFAYPLPDGWILDANETATFEVELDEPDCVVIPSDPIVVQASCIVAMAEVPTLPSIDLGVTDGISYRTDGEVVAGNTVDVIATITGAGLAFPDPIPAGWVDNGDNTATFEVVLIDPDCILFDPIPVPPVVTQPTCNGSDVTLPEVLLATTEGLTYAIDGTVAAGETVTVIATLEDRYVFPALLPDEWTDNGDGTASYVVVLEDPDCAIPVTPAPTEDAGPTETPGTDDPEDPRATQTPTDETPITTLPNTGDGSGWSGSASSMAGLMAIAIMLIGAARVSGRWRRSR
jgi:hypothetical protein